MARPRPDLTGRRIGHVTIVGWAGYDAKRRGTWRLLCDCGTSWVVKGDGLLRRGATFACRRDGCQHHPSRLHGHCRTKRLRSPEYRTWDAMRYRCLSPTSKQWADYGGRGITIDPRWAESFEAFYADMGPRPSPLHTLDRIDNDGPYAPGNVRWATKQEQANNRRPRRWQRKPDLVREAENLRHSVLERATR